MKREAGATGGSGSLAAGPHEGRKPMGLAPLEHTVEDIERVGECNDALPNQRPVLGLGPIDHRWAAAVGDIDQRRHTLLPHDGEDRGPVLAVGDQEPDLTTPDHAVDHHMLTLVRKRSRGMLAIALSGNLPMQGEKMLDPLLTEPVGLGAHLPHGSLAYPGLGAQWPPPRPGG